MAIEYLCFSCKGEFTCSDNTPQTKCWWCKSPALWPEVVEDGALEPENAVDKRVRVYRQNGGSEVGVVQRDFVGEYSLCDPATGYSYGRLDGSETILLEVAQ